MFLNMKKLLTIIISLCFLSGIMAQGTVTRQVISAGGNTVSEEGGVLLSWTIGETVVNTVVEGDITLYQGFQQPFFTEGGVITHVIPLNLGWNTLSTYVKVGNATNFLDVIEEWSGIPFVNNMSNLLVFSQGSHTAYPWNTSSYVESMIWEDAGCIQLFNQQPAGVLSLTIMGEYFPEAEQTYTLAKNAWGRVPVLSPNKLKVSDYVHVSDFGSGEIFYMKSDDGTSYMVAEGYIISSTLGYLMPGLGHDAYTTKDVTFNFAGGKKSGVNHAPEMPKNPWNEVIVTPNYHVIFATAETLEGGDVMEAGDVLGVFTQKGVCAGKAVYTGEEGIVLQAYAADEMSKSNGFTANEVMIFKLYRPSTQEVFNLNITWDTENAKLVEGLFTVNGFSEIGGLKSITGISDYVAGISVYPNPAKDYIVLNVEGGISAKAQYVIYGAEDGKLSISQNLTKTSTQIDITSLSSGVYFVKVIDQDQVFVEKFVKQK
jgi:hypothetical protein